MIRCNGRNVDVYVINHTNLNYILWSNSVLFVSCVVIPYMFLLLCEQRLYINIKLNSHMTNASSLNRQDLEHFL